MVASNHWGDLGQRFGTTRGASARKYVGDRVRALVHNAGKGQVLAYRAASASMGLRRAARHVLISGIRFPAALNRAVLKNAQ
jgi:hypothetical protein